MGRLSGPRIEAPVPERSGEGRGSLPLPESMRSPSTGAVQRTPFGFESVYGTFGCNEVGVAFVDAVAGAAITGVVAWIVRTSAPSVSQDILRVCNSMSELGR